jgi:thiamine transporter
MKKKNEIISLCEVAIFAAIGFVLDFAANLYSGFIFPSGGSLSFALIAVVIISFRRGTIYGVSCGLIIGLLDLTDGFYTISDTWYKAFMQVGLDYVFTYMLVGLSGLFKPLCKKIKPSFVIVFSTVFAGCLKFLSHFLSGVLFWPEFPNQPFVDRCIYSVLYNGSYMLPTIIISAIIVFLITINYQKLFLIDDLENA